MEQALFIMLVSFPCANKIAKWVYGNGEEKLLYNTRCASHGD